MDFTREPIIETVVTPKEGCKLVIRSSKGTGQEEYFVDALEVVSFGHAIFYRSLERPKAFLVPASDYEVLEVREARMVLKNVGLDRSIKIGGGREAAPKKEAVQEKPIASTSEEEVTASSDETSDAKDNRKRDRRRQSRRKRNTSQQEGEEATTSTDGQSEILSDAGEVSPEPPTQTGATLASILPPPPMLISETIGRYKDNILFKGAFYVKEEQLPIEPITDVPPLVQPEYGSFEMTIEEDEDVYKQRTNLPTEFLEETDDLIPSSHTEEESFPEKDYSLPKEQDPS